MATVRFDRYKLSLTVMRRFAFLAKDYSFKKLDLGEADEFIDRYVGVGIAVTITFSYPELLFLILAKRAPADASYRYCDLPKGPAVKLRDRYYNLLKKNPTPHEQLWDMQAEFADTAAEEVRTALLRRQKKPRAQLGPRWVLLSHRFPEIPAPKARVVLHNPKSANRLK